jgi:hypothetical protein
LRAFGQVQARDIALDHEYRAQAGAVERQFLAAEPRRVVEANPSMTIADAGGVSIQSASVAHSVAAKRRGRAVVREETSGTSWCDGRRVNRGRDEIQRAMLPEF